MEAVRSYADKLDDWADAHVIVMPYAEVPNDLDEELETLADEGAKIVRAESGSDGWPVIPLKKRLTLISLNRSASDFGRSFLLASPSRRKRCPLCVFSSGL